MLRPWTSIVWTSTGRPLRGGRRGSWDDVKRLAVDIRAAGLPFSLIYWAAGLPAARHQGRANEDTWCNEVAEQARAVDGVGLEPDQYVVESWVGAPSRITSNLGSGCTFMQSAGALGNKL